MSDFTAGPPSGGHEGGSDTPGGGPPLVLIAALTTALLIAVGVIAAFASLGGDNMTEPLPDSRADSTTTTADERVLLTVAVDGSGMGRVQITPSDVSCNRSCEYKFRSDARVTATAEPSVGSTFEGWGDACSGTGRCSFVMDRPRSLSATFAEEPAPDALCEGVPPEEQDPTCPPDDEPETPREPPAPNPDCSDGRDNDNDGLTDSVQDPDCDAGGNESGAGAPTDDTAPPAPSIHNECTDGRDNDSDGLTDREQDPDCEKGRFESG